MTTIRLENVFLKNVMFYLETMDDVCNFNQINKKCGEAIATVFINPYKLSQFYTFSQINKIFPSLQTYYCAKSFCTPKMKEAGNMPLMEIGTWDKGLPTTVFSTKWFAEKVRKIRITRPIIHSFIKGINNYRNLIHLTITIEYKEVIVIEKIIQIKSIQKIIVYSDLYKVLDLVQTKFISTQSKAQLYLIQTNNKIQNILDKNQIDKSYPNIHYYSGDIEAPKDEYLSVSQYSFIISTKNKNFRLKSYESTLLNTEDLKQTANIIEKYEISKLFFSHQGKTSVETNLSMFMNVTEISLDKVKNKLTLPLAVKRLNMKQCNVCFVNNGVRLKEIRGTKRCFISGEVCIEELKVFSFDNSKVKMSWIDHGKIKRVGIDTRLDVIVLKNTLLCEPNTLPYEEKYIDCLSIKRGKSLILGGLNNQLSIDLHTFNFRVVEISGCDIKELMIGNITSTLTFKSPIINFWNIGEDIKPVKIQKLQCGTIGKIVAERYLDCKNFYYKGIEVTISEE
ncbi:hypothetical protein ENUP19_0228G0006 [Entamoeba nuttalli]|uniref:Uncharacterized protein n=2 Tax=Entamoeba nuttalli TaxID=412467 RepID=K2HS28_ENTNP|nr:hypothetical protein ENU1_149830 [Entamoeba nuttalli P19]EKE38860.1 hypothetical protein ENU1_149830 [Entamoeba nuttalli P19]|eukprot:XP_008858805.1 hypothetical protein ENU1_149830 [Entamoeba nuttalli P19]